MPQAYYMNGLINVSFNSALDHSVIISVRNLSNGTQIQELINTSMMMVTIDVSEIISSGDFIIEFLYDNGDTYIGYFAIQGLYEKLLQIICINIDPFSKCDVLCRKDKGKQDNVKVY